MPHPPILGIPGKLSPQNTHFIVIRGSFSLKCFPLYGTYLELPYPFELIGVDVVLAECGIPADALVEAVFSKDWLSRW